MSRAQTWLTEWHRDATLPTVPQMGAEVLDICAKLEACQQLTVKITKGFADTTRDYRMEKARHILQAHDELVKATGREKPSVAEKGAWVTLRVAVLKHDQMIAEEMKWANQQAQKNLLAELSAMQSLLKAYSNELSWARQAPNQ